ncbi:TPA: hypothetical protein ACJEU7_002384 [Acinetobacter baumannii]|uniref:hypothetical protein n=1 Tax=Acinetobacter baumannii TaxID=470 RepID=UPI0022519F60|nr:hypothetical protein [Acinetobacter baumannii]MCX3034160.1 hypothetical protein [Acinetobacter baumannii]
MLDVVIAQPMNRKIVIMNGYTDLVQSLKDGKELHIDAYLKTSTRISTSIFCGETRLNFNIDDAAYAFHYENSTSFMTGEMRQICYFKLSKKQTTENYIDYIQKAIQQFLEHEKLTDKVKKITICSDFIQTQQ